uniref:Uncharacterized protein n=1 Tax=Tanacetum cinerariifolium TaxID=118510 RepID=A0A699I5I5_TANCI|nr:hypothetical protein [Tanacetum cinerariifolium]
MRLKKAKEAWEVLKQEFQGERMTRYSGKAIESAFQSNLQGDKKPHLNFGKESSPRGGREAEILEVVDADKVTEVLEVEAILTKDHLAMKTFTSVTFTKKKITKKKTVGTKESLNAPIVMSLVIWKNFVDKRRQEDGNVFLCHSANVEISDTWFLDSGCSNHMTCD